MPDQTRNKLLSERQDLAFAISPTRSPTTFSPFSPPVTILVLLDIGLQAALFGDVPGMDTLFIMMSASMFHDP